MTDVVVARARFEGVSRGALEVRILDLEEQLALVERDRDAYLDNLTHVQTRCTQLLEETREQRAAIALIDLIGLPDVSPGQRKVLGEVVLERQRQDEQWGSLAERKDVPDGTDSRHWDLDEVRADVGAHCRETGRETCCWAHVLEEESLEALSETDPVQLRMELVQVAAVACVWAEALDRRSRPDAEDPNVHRG